MEEGGPLNGGAEKASRKIKHLMEALKNGWVEPSKVNENKGAGGGGDFQSGETTWSEKAQRV